MNKKEMSSYETDASRLIGNAKRVVFPKSVEDVQKYVKGADYDIIARGAGTGLVGGCVPSDSLIVDLSKMNAVKNFNPSKREVYVE